MKETPAPPIVADRRRADRRREARPELADPNASLRPLPEPGTQNRVLPGPWPKGDFRVDPEA